MAPVGSGQLRIVSFSFEEATLVMFEVGFIQLAPVSRGMDYTPHSKKVSGPSPMSTPQLMRVKCPRESSHGAKCGLPIYLLTILPPSGLYTSCFTPRFRGAAVVESLWAFPQFEGLKDHGNLGVYFWRNHPQCSCHT